VPELAAVPPRFAHEPHLMSLEEQARARCRIGRDYPSPIVDHQAARQDYLDRGKQLVRQ
jgi:deoxyribodipyrimidine photo-lyase